MPAQLNLEYIMRRPSKAITRSLSYALFEGRPLTTRGRFINPLVFLNLFLGKKFPKFREIEKPVFIIGMGRSGTTIIGVILSIHIDVGFLNEPKAMWHSIYPHEDIIGNYSNGLARYRLLDTDVTETLRESAHRLFGYYLFFTGSRRVVDKYPEHVFRVSFVRSIFHDARFVFLARSGWDTCDSVQTWSKTHSADLNRETHDWWGADRRKWNLIIEQIVLKDPEFQELGALVPAIKNQYDMAAVEWIVSMREGLKCLELYPDSVRMFRYEDLLSRPEEGLEQLLDHCMLRPDKVFIEYSLSQLRPPKRRKPRDMHPVLKKMFLKTMDMLGY